MSRLQLDLNERPSFLSQSVQLLERVRLALEKVLECAIGVEARVLGRMESPSKSFSSFSGFTLFEIIECDSAAIVEVEYALLGSLFSRLSKNGGPGPLGKLTQIEQAAFAYLSLAALAEFRNCDSMSKAFYPRLLNVTSNADEVRTQLEGSCAYFGLSIGMTIGATKGAVRVLVPIRALERGLQNFPSAPEQVADPQLLSVEVGIDAFLGNTAIDIHDWQGIGPGDTIVFKDLRLTAGLPVGMGWLKGPGFWVAGEFVDRGFSILDIIRERNMTQHAKGGLNVEVEIQLTQLRMTLGELTRLKPGAVLPLHVRPEGPVALRLGDKIVADAELVEIDGEVGARIISLTP